MHTIKKNAVVLKSYWSNAYFNCFFWYFVSVKCPFLWIENLLIKVGPSFSCGLMFHIKTHDWNLVSNPKIWDAFDFQHKSRYWLYICCHHNVCHQVGFAKTNYSSSKGIFLLIKVWLKNYENFKPYDRLKNLKIALIG